MSVKFSKDTIIERKLGSLKNLIVTDRLDLEEWQTREGIYLGGGRYQESEEAPGTIRTGDRWRCGDDQTRWFQTEVTVPESFEGKPLALELEFGGESIVRMNGEILSALTSYLHPSEATRTRVMLTDCADPGAVYQVEAEAHLNYMEFSEFRRQGATEIEYTFRTAALVTLNPEAEAYYFDIRTAFDAMKTLRNPIDLIAKSPARLPHEVEAMVESFSKDTFYYERVKDAVVSSLSQVDFDFEKERTLSSLPKARQVFAEKMAAIPGDAHTVIKFVGQAHIDTAWLWPVRESIRKSAKTFSNVCSLMDRYPEFIFAFSQPQLFEFMKDHYPELYERIKEKVRAGQLELVGNTWVEMDTNIPSGESLVRQILYGRQFFLQEFGTCSDVFWMPDVFGYSWALPQIIRRSGMKYFFTSKLINNDDNRFPYSLFQWQGVDGTRIPAYLQRLNYNGQVCAQTLATLYSRFDQKDVLDEALMTFGYGDGGGGPTYQMLETARRLEAFPGLPKLEIATSESFFRDAEPVFPELPVWNDEMYYEFHRGTYTSQADVKKNNRKSELLYRQAEMACVFDLEENGTAYPYEEFLGGYKKLLTNQFHDIMPGSSIHAVYEDARKDYKVIQGVGNALLERAADRLARGISHEANTLVVWNFLSWERTDTVRMPLQGTAWAAAEKIRVLDGSGNPVASGIVHENGERVLRFSACVPPMGYSCYRLVQGESQECQWPVVVSRTCLENRFFRLELDGQGNLSEIWDKRCNRPVLRGVSNLLKIFEDKPGGETAWNIDIEYQNKEWVLDQAESVEVSCDGGVVGSIRTKRRFNRSVITQEIVLHSDLDRIDFRTYVDWDETEKMLKAEFNLEVHSSKAAYEIQFGAIERPTHDNTSYDRTKFEVSAHKWADLSEGSYGVSLLNDCKYGYDTRENRMRLTLLRSSIDPDPTADRGHHEFTYALRPHEGGWVQAGTVNAGYGLNVPLYPVFCPKSGEGTLPAEKSYLSSSRPNVVIDTVKAAEDGSGVILRVYEATGSRTDAAVTVGFPADQAVECNLMEERERDLEFDGRILRFTIKPFEIKTFLLLRDGRKIERN